MEATGLHLVPCDLLVPAQQLAVGMVVAWRHVSDALSLPAHWMLQNLPQHSSWLLHCCNEWVTHGTGQVRKVYIHPSQRSLLHCHCSLRAYDTAGTRSTHLCSASSSLLVPHTVAALPAKRGRSLSFSSHRALLPPSQNLCVQAQQGSASGQDKEGLICVRGTKPCLLVTAVGVERRYGSWAAELGGLEQVPTVVMANSVTACFSS